MVLESNLVNFREEAFFVREFKSSLKKLDVLIIRNRCRSLPVMRLLRTALENTTEKARSVTEEESV